MTDLQLDEILTLRWPGVVRRVMGDAEASAFTKSFARSIARDGKRHEWRPSHKQERIMRQMLADYSGPTRAEPELIERN